jgi:hypothetical protein
MPKELYKCVASVFRLMWKDSARFRTKWKELSFSNRRWLRPISYKGSFLVLDGLVNRSFS